MAPESDANPSRRAGESRGIPSYFPALDGLRFFCASAVVVSHAFYEARIVADRGHPLHDFVENLGATGVNVFFSLSGFLITKLLLDELLQSGRIQLAQFYIRRTLRIWPVYYVALAAGFGLTAVLRDRFARSMGYTIQPELWTHALPAYAVFLGNWSTTRVPTALNVLWSVCVEEQFYLLFPLSFAWRRSRHPVVVPALIGLAVAWLVRGSLAFVSAPESTIYRNPFSHADHLLLGAALAQLLHARPASASALFRRIGLAGELALIVALLAMTALPTPHVGAVGPWLASYFVSALITTGLVGVFALGDGPVCRALARPTLRRLGGLTYAAYAFHIYAVVLAWAACRHVLDTPWLGASLRAAVAIPVAFAIAWLSRRLLEERFLAMKARFAPR